MKRMIGRFFNYASGVKSGFIMDDSLFHRSEFLERLLDIIPALIMVVDDDVTILDANRELSNFWGIPREKFINERGGNILNCVNSHDSPQGCGRGTQCKTCILRNSVGEAVKGKKVSRKQTTMKFDLNGETKSLNLLITAAPFEYRGAIMVLLIMENISELVQLRKLIPICSSCKKIRDDKDYWKEVEHYFKELIDADFSHGICPDCLKKLYPEIYFEMMKEKSKRQS